MRAFTLVVLLLAACGQSSRSSAPDAGQPDSGQPDAGVQPAQLPPCGAPPFFTVLPVDRSAVASVGPLGHVFPPGHSVPSDHGGIYLAAAGVTLRSPGPLHVDSVRSTSYLVSPSRQGQVDYTISFRACAEVSGVLGHIQSLSPKLQALLGTGHCVTYGSPETVQACSENVSVDLAAGETIGAVGGPSAMAFDFGTYDDRHANAFLSPARFSGPTLHAVCPWDLFPPDLRDFALGRVGYGSDFRTDEPRCGAVQVDLAGTAQGVWVDAAHAADAAQNGDESIFVTLAGDEVHPSTKLALALGPGALGSTLVSVPAQHSGRYNRAFAEVTDAAIHCYWSGSPSAPAYFVQLSGASLFIEQRAGGCPPDPTSWAMSANAMRLVR